MRFRTQLVPVAEGLALKWCARSGATRQRGGGRGSVWRRVAWRLPGGRLQRLVAGERSCNGAVGDSGLTGLDLEKSVGLTYLNMGRRVRRVTRRMRRVGWVHEGAPGLRA